MSPKRAKARPERPRWWSLVLCVLMGAGLLFAASRAVHWAKEKPDWSFDPLRLALRSASPAWLEPPMARAVYGSYERIAGDGFALHDTAAFAAWAERVERLSWVARADARPRYPNRVFLDLELRRPRLCLAEGRILVLADAEGRPLPLLRADAGIDVDVHDRFARAARAEADLPPQPFGLPWVLGLSSIDTDRDALRGAAALGEEWRIEVEDLLERLSDGVRPPVLLAIDCSNHGLRLDGRRAEYSLLLASRDQRPVRVAWGHAPGGAFDTRIPVEEKARVLALVLREYPGLEGVGACDVRYTGSWRRRVVAAAR